MGKRIGEEYRRKKKKCTCREVGGRRKRVLSIINSSGYPYFIVLKSYNRLIIPLFSCHDCQRSSEVISLSVSWNLWLFSEPSFNSVWRNCGESG